jgi:hypothetical protein
MGDVQVPVRLEQDNLQAAFRHLLDSPRVRGSGADDEGVICCITSGHKCGSRSCVRVSFAIGSEPTMARRQEIISICNNALSRERALLPSW